MPLLYLNEVASLSGSGSDRASALTAASRARCDCRPSGQADPIAVASGSWGAVLLYRAVARRLCHGLPAPCRCRRVRRSGTGASVGARQSRQPGLLRLRFREGRRGHRLCALRSGPRRSCRHRRPALLYRGAARQFRFPARQGPDRRGARPLRRTFACERGLRGGGGRSSTALARLCLTARTMAAACATLPASSRSPPSSSRRASTPRRWPTSWPACAIRARYTSTQEDAWTLVAAANLGRATCRAVRWTIDGRGPERAGLSPLRCRRSGPSAGFHCQ